MYILRAHMSKKKICQYMNLLYIDCCTHTNDICISHRIKTPLPTDGEVSIIFAWSKSIAVAVFDKNNRNAGVTH